MQPVTPRPLIWKWKIPRKVTRWVLFKAASLLLCLETPCVVDQSCWTLYDPMDCSLPGSFRPWDSPGKNTGVGCHSLLQGGLPNPGIEPGSPALQADSLPSEPQGTLIQHVNEVRGAETIGPSSLEEEREGQEERGARLGPQGQLLGGALQSGPSLVGSNPPNISGGVWTNSFLACSQVSHL